MSCCDKDKTSVSKSYIQERYGSQLDGSCEDEAPCGFKLCDMRPEVKKSFSLIHDDVMGKNFGCGLVVPEVLGGCHVVDLGSGAGRDCFSLSYLVGDEGKVTGVDMTQKMVDFANSYKEYHREKFEHNETNIRFLLGHIEELRALGIEPNSADIVISNCVICLSLDKKAVFREAFEILKDGGELYFSDMYADGPVDPDVKKDPYLWSEGFGGSLFWKDFVSMATEIGYTPPRIVHAAPINMKSAEVQEKIGNRKYAAITFRVFKISDFDHHHNCEAVYKGGIPNAEDEFKFDRKTIFKKGEAKIVDYQLGHILKRSRFAPYFTLTESTEDEEVLEMSEDNPFCAGC